MPDKFPPKNSGFRLGTYRFPSDVSPCRHAIYNWSDRPCDCADPTPVPLTDSHTIVTDPARFVMEENPMTQEDEK